MANLNEETVKVFVRDAFFPKFKLYAIGKIDFVIAKAKTKDGAYLLLEEDDANIESLLWAEAKQGTKNDIYASFVQVILTIGKERTFERYLPPKYVGALDKEKIAFLEYHEIQSVFEQNDFNWNVKPSDHTTDEFRQLYEMCKKVLMNKALVFEYRNQGKELKEFIKANFDDRAEVTEKIPINKNNFTHIYRRWREKVMPFIDAKWNDLKTKYSIYDSDFYLAEMNIDDNNTSEIEDDHVASADFSATFDANSTRPYSIRRMSEDALFTNVAQFGFKPGGLDAYASFWRLYKRPPQQEYWEYIKNRRDLLVPSDIRQVKGAFYTPAIWVEKSQQYLADVLGENWQDEYYIWDCCAGTGNLLAFLMNKNNIWASTIDQQDVDVMSGNAEEGKVNLWKSHIFRFDFLNDSFDKLPQELKEIINDPEKRKKLVVYINPPYKEAATAHTTTGTGANIPGVAKNNLVHAKYKPMIGKAANELFALFLMRICDEIPGCIIGQFSTPKHVQAPNFKKFRKVFNGKLEKSFVVPADTFDNVKGKFPIGFFIWKLDGKTVFVKTRSDIYDRDGDGMGQKVFRAHNGRLINEWYTEFYDNDSANETIAIMNTRGNDFQNYRYVHISSFDNHNHTNRITVNNLIPSVVYLAARHAVGPTWLNNRDQFLAPKDSWMEDATFLSDCLVWALFDNTVKSADGDNHWIPFAEDEVGAKDCFSSHFMSDFLSRKNKICVCKPSLLDAERKDVEFVPLKCLSSEAKSVMDAGRELWRYYHSKTGVNVNASYYDIQRYFQGTKITDKGKVVMKSDCLDSTYTKHMDNIQAAMKALGKHIKPKLYEHVFLLK